MHSEYSSVPQVTLEESARIDTSLLRSALASALRETLEVMFFVDVLDEMPAPDLHPAGARSEEMRSYRVRVHFHGDHSGLLDVTIEFALAAYCHIGFQPSDGFSAPEEVMDDDMDEDSDPTVSLTESVLEMANIVCGSMLSALWPDMLFSVDKPTLAPEGEMPALPPDTACRLATAEGFVTAEFWLDSRPDGRPAPPGNSD